MREVINSKYETIERASVSASKGYINILRAYQHTKAGQMPGATDQSGPWVDGSWVMGQMGHVNRWVTWVMGHGSVTHDP